MLFHGGPGATHEYWECAESFLPHEGIEFIYYDLLGSWYSDLPDDSSLWVTERFVEEVDQVRKALGLNKDNFYLMFLLSMQVTGARILVRSEFMALVKKI